MVGRNVNRPFQLLVDELLCALLNLGHGDRTGRVQVRFPAKQTVPHSLCGKSAFTRFIKADFG